MNPTRRVPGLPGDVLVPARTVLVHPSEPWPDGARIANIAELPDAIARLGSTHDTG